MRWDGATCQSTYASLSLLLPSTFPFSATLFNNEPISFRCPGCEAEYKLVTVEVCDIVQGKIRCLKCDALLPAGEGRVAFKYLLVGPSGRNRRRK
jgi:hypothetical protein